MPHFHHSHEIAKTVALEEIDHQSHDGEHHHHDSEEQSEDDGNFLLAILLESHTHNTEIKVDSEFLINYNKILVGKNIPIITLYTSHCTPPEVSLTTENNHFQYKQHFQQEQIALNYPLRAPPTLG